MNSADKGIVLHCLKALIDEEVCEECPIYGMTGTDHCEKDMIRLAVNALDKQTCEDAISRQAAIDAIWDGINMDIYTREVKEVLEGLPPVTTRCKEG